MDPIQAALEAQRRYLAGASGAGSGSPAGTSQQVPSALTNPNLFGGYSVDPSAADRQAQSPWSSDGLDVPTGGWSAGGAGSWGDVRERALASQSQDMVVKQWELGLDADLQAVEDSRFESVQDYKRLAEVAITSIEADDESAQQLGQQLLHQLRDVDAFRGVFSAINPERGFEDYYRAPEEPNAALRGLAWLGEKLDASSQFSLGLITDLSGLRDTRDVGSAVRRTGEAALSLADAAIDGLTTVGGLKAVQAISEQLGTGEYTKFVMPDYWSEEIKDAGHDWIPDPRDVSQYDDNEDGRIEFLEALGVDEDWGKGIGLNVGPARLDVRGVTNFAGEVVTDPLTYVTFGSGGLMGRAASSGMHTLDNIVLTKGAALVQRGALQADEFDRLVVIHSKLRSGTPWKKFGTDADKDFLRDVLTREAMTHKTMTSVTQVDLSSRATRGISRQADQMARRAGGGMFMGGVPVAGTRQVAQMGRRAGLIGEKWVPAERAFLRSVQANRSQMDDQLGEVIRLVKQMDEEELIQRGLPAGLTDSELTDYIRQTVRTESVGASSIKNLVHLTDDEIFETVDAARSRAAREFGFDSIPLEDVPARLDPDQLIQYEEWLGKAYEYGKKRKQNAFSEQFGQAAHSMMDSTYATSRRISQGKVAHNPYVNRLRNKIDKVFVPFARTADVHGDVRAKMMRQMTGDITTRAETLRQEATNALLDQHARAGKEAEAVFGMKSGPAKVALNEQIARIRDIRGKKRFTTLATMEAEGRTEFVKLVRLLDQLAHEMRGQAEELGNQTSKMWDPKHYAPRKIDDATIDLLNQLKTEAGEPWEKLLELSTTRQQPILDDMVDRGVLTAAQAAETDLGSLLAPWTHSAPFEMVDELDDAMNLHTLLIGNKEGKRRTFLPEVKDVVKLNEKIAKIFDEAGIQITDFYDIDPVDSFIRYMDTWSDSRVVHDILGQMQEVTVGNIRTGDARPGVVQGTRETRARLDDFGEKIDGEFEVSYTWHDPIDGAERIMRADNSDDLIEKMKKVVTNSNYQVRPVGSGKFYLVDTTIGEEIDNVILPRIKRGATESSIMRTISKWNSIWAAHATVPLIGTAFHARNTIGNWFNMSLAGFKNPKYLSQAVHYQAVNKAVHKHMSKAGFLNWDEAAYDMLNKKVNYTVGRISPKITAKDVDTLRLLRDNGAISGSFFSDMRTDRILFSGADQKHGLISRLTDNPMINTGQAVGSTIENNSRIALFLDGLDQGMTPAAASARVKKFLFDYSDLSPFEDHNLKSISRFYTWMRKNTELQVRMMLSAPGSVWNTQKALDSVMGSLFGDDGDPRARGFLVPEFAEDGIMMFNAQDTFLHGYETPLISALDVAGSAFSLAALIPGGETIVPGPFKANESRDYFNGILSLVASGPTTALNYIYENATGVDTFTGGQISDSLYAKSIRAIETLFPSVSKLAREFERFEGFEFVGLEEDGWGLVSEHQEGQAGMRMMNLLLGVNVYSLNEEQQARALSAVSGMYDEKRRDLRNEGIEFPTMEELREGGKVAEADMLLSAMFFATNPVTSIEAKLPTGFKEFIAQELGLPIDMVQAEEKSLEHLARDAEAFYEMVEFRLQRNLSTTEKWQLGFQLPGVPSNPELEALGLNPYRENQFIEAEDAEANIARAQAWLTALAPTWGMTEQEVLAANPLLSEAQIFMSDALASGMAPEQAMQEYIAELSRTRRAQLFGVNTLEEFDYEKSMTDEERLALNRRIWEDAMQYMVIADYFGMPMSTQAAINYVNYGADRLLQGERELLGLPLRQSIPNREDPRAEDERTQEAGMTWDQIVMGATGATTGSLPPGVGVPAGLLPPDSSGW